jgi:hypothetical protein
MDRDRARAARHVCAIWNDRLPLVQRSAGRASGLRLCLGSASADRLRRFRPVDPIKAGRLVAGERSPRAVHI